MSGECEKCNEHTLDCKCNSKINLVANILAQNILDTMYTLAYETIRKAGLWDEFIEFSKKYPLCTMDVIKEFGSMHPEKLYYSEQTESYGHFVMMPKKEDRNE